ncbi:MAG: hypothetical protein JXR03_18360 [Cyclobacteriaceae bacterium]
MNNETAYYGYYGEVVARISGVLHYNSSEDELSNIFNDGDTVFTFSAEAARIFNTLEDLSGEMNVDWLKALERYSCKLLSALINKQKPNVVDMISMAACSMENSR